MIFHSKFIRCRRLFRRKMTHTRGTFRKFHFMYLLYIVILIIRVYTARYFQSSTKKYNIILIIIWIRFRLGTAPHRTAPARVVSRARDLYFTLGIFFKKPHPFFFWEDGRWRGNASSRIYNNNIIIYNIYIDLGLATLCGGSLAAVRTKQTFASSSSVYNKIKYKSYVCVGTIDVSGGVAGLLPAFTIIL